MTPTWSPGEPLKYFYLFCPLFGVLLWAALASFNANFSGIYWVAGVALIAVIVASVHFAEVISEILGSALGTLILALSVTVLEAGLILSIVSTGGEGTQTVARDAIFSAVMVVVHGIMGASVFMGGLKHRVQGFNAQGALTLLLVLLSLCFLTLVLPNYTVSSAGPTYTISQLIFASIFSVLLYLAIVVAQTKTQMSFFTSNVLDKEQQIQIEPARGGQIWFPALQLVLSLFGVIMLAKFLSPAFQSALHQMGAPAATSGLVIAVIVLMPEALAAVHSAKKNNLQTSLNLALGSGAASVALTIPVVAIYSIMTKTPLVLGLQQKEMAFLILTFLISGLTLSTGKSTALQGLVHLFILLAYFVVSFIP